MNGGDCCGRKVSLCFRLRKAFNHRIPLGDKLPALGLDERIKAIQPYIACIRKHLEVVTGIALDVKAFKALPPHYFQILGDNPFFTAFLRMILRILELTGPKLPISLICDDEEQMAEPMYKLYRRVKLVWPEAREVFAAISFADDKRLWGLQAADIVASLFRREADKEFFGTRYEYEPLFAELIKPPQAHEPIWSMERVFCDSATLISVADSLKKEKEERLKKTEKPQP
jgi:hypothetical protein